MTARRHDNGGDDDDDERHATTCARDGDDGVYMVCSRRGGLSGWPQQQQAARQPAFLGDILEKPRCVLSLSSKCREPLCARACGEALFNYAPRLEQLRSGTLRRACGGSLFNAIVFSSSACANLRSVRIQFITWNRKDKSVKSGLRYNL